jgi:hypothetical protein
MITKRAKRSTKKVTSLKAKGVSAKQEKRVKGGVELSPISITKTTDNASRNYE